MVDSNKIFLDIFVKNELVLEHWFCRNKYSMRMKDHAELKFIFKNTYRLDDEYLDCLSDIYINYFYYLLQQNRDQPSYLPFMDRL